MLEIILYYFVIKLFTSNPFLVALLFSADAASTAFTISRTFTMILLMAKMGGIGFVQQKTSIRIIDRQLQACKSNNLQLNNLWMGLREHNAILMETLQLNRCLLSPLLLTAGTTNMPAGLSLSSLSMLMLHRNARLVTATTVKSAGIFFLLNQIMFTLIGLEMLSRFNRLLYRSAICHLYTIQWLLGSSSAGFYNGYVIIKQKLKVASYIEAISGCEQPKLGYTVGSFAYINRGFIASVSCHFISSLN